MAIWGDDSKNPLLCRNLASLAVFGLWPFQTEAFLSSRRLRSLHYTAGLVVYIFNFLFLITEYVELVHVWGNIELMTTNMSVTFLTTIGAMKMHGFFGHRRKLKRLVEGIATVETSIMQYQNEEIKDLLRAYVARARMVTYFFWSLTSGTIVVFFIIPLVEYRFSTEYHIIYKNGSEYWSNKRPMIFSTWIPFDKYAPGNYFYAYAFQILFGVIGAGYQAVWDTFVVSMMIHSIGQLRILQKKISDSTKISPEDFTTEPLISHDEILQRRLVNCVNHHLYIMNYTRELNEILRPVMLLYFMICSLMLCAIGFQASLYGFGYRLCLMVEYLIAMMIQLFLSYWHGNTVVYESEQLLTASYDCKWYNESHRFKKSLWILREGTKLPIKFTVGPFYTMCLPTFLAILRVSYSYFTLLRQLQEDQ